MGRAIAVRLQCGLPVVRVSKKPSSTRVFVTPTSPDGVFSAAKVVFSYNRAYYE
jgi:hypothetical protein